MELYKLPVHQLVKKLRAKEVSSYDITKSFIDRIETFEKNINAFNYIENNALEKAKEIDKKIADNNVTNQLAGIPIAIKDNICTEGVLTTCSSKILANFIPPYNATVMEKINQAGMIVLGKTNLDEFAMGSSTENSSTKFTSNPYNLEYVPGGSSGGSAACVSAYLSPLSLGSDTGGSIRLPASFCGNVGMKPTYGLVSRYGLIAYASSLDQIGPFSNNVTDNALLLHLIAGHDKYDSTSVNAEIPNYLNSLEQTKDGLKGLRIGIPREMMEEGLNSEVKESINNSIKKLESLGAIVEEMSLPLLKYSLAAYYIIATAEASSNLARFDGVKYGLSVREGVKDLENLYLETRSQGFGDEVKRRIMLGTYVLSSGYYDAYYKKAQQFRTLLIKDLESAFSKYDILISPTCATTAFKRGEKSDPLSMYVTDILTVMVNLAGIPALSMPSGFDSNGMPIGIQLMAKPLGEGTIYKTAYHLEQELNLENKISF